MKITLEPTHNQLKETYPYPKVTIDSPRDDLDIEEAMSLVEKALVAWGFHPDTVQDYYKEDSKVEE